MDVIDGNWIMRGIGWDDPKCIHSADELAAVVNEIGFLPLFSNEIEGFSVEEMTSSEHWWSGDTSVDPWEWRAILARRNDIAYGKFFNKKAGFISKKWFPYFANCRRGGYDFDARYEDGKASHRENLIMKLFMPNECDINDVTKSIAKQLAKEFYSYEVKNLAGFGKDGEKNFEGTVTGLEMQTYLVVQDFRQKTNKRGEGYGWPIAVYTLPEYLWGYDHVTKRYSEEPETSFDKIAKCVKKHFVNVEAKDIKKVVSCYREFEARVSIAYVSGAKSTSYDVVKAYVSERIGKFSKQEVLMGCPSLGSSSVESALKKLVEDGTLVRIGAGRKTLYARVPMKFV